jgi:hypothetical protein
MASTATVDGWKAAAIKNAAPTTDSERIRKAIATNTDRMFAGEIDKDEWSATQFALWDEAASLGCSRAVAYAISH